MGTRHLICVVRNGEYKVAQYGQWDGYPEGQGSTALLFMHSIMAVQGRLDQFKAKIDACYWITEDELKTQWVKSGAKPDSEFVSIDVAKKHTYKYPESSRDTGARILELIWKKKKAVGLVNSLDFAADSLFCEWAYVVDLDKMTFEVYEGFNHEPLDPSERFASLPKKEKTYPEQEEYYPIKLVKLYDLNYLPAESDFLKEIGDLTKEESDDDDDGSVTITLEDLIGGLKTDNENA